MTEALKTGKVNAVLNEVLRERIRQHAKWGEQNHPDGTRSGPGERAMASGAKAVCNAAHKIGADEWRMVLNEEVLEAFAETDEVKLRDELIQVAAVAVQWVEAIDRRKK